jgi:glyoxylase-like metal-dependent hydrolase (beta-lactamase superfamily II)
MQVSPSVRAVQIPESNPMHPQFTTIYIVGRDQVLTIDSGMDEERFRWMLRGYLAATERAEIGQATVTHFHFDHSSNIRWLCEEFDADALLAPETAQRMGEKLLPPKGYNRVIEGESIYAGGGVRLQTIHTPGHSPESFCYYLEEEGVLFSGDTLLGGSTTTVNDLSDYMQSLERLRDLPNLKVICPGHGPLIHEPARVLGEYIEHRNQREAQILGVLGEGDAVTSWQIMERLYPDIDSRLRRAADGNVRSHLAKLEKEGRVTVHAGTPRHPDADEAGRLAAEAAERDETLRKADEIRTQMQRRAIFLQENPPTQEWQEPPRYELS